MHSHPSVVRVTARLASSAPADGSDPRRRRSHRGLAAAQPRHREPRSPTPGLRCPPSSSPAGDGLRWPPVDTAKVAAIVGATSVDRATPAFVREHTGFAIGGVAPVAHPGRCALWSTPLEATTRSGPRPATTRSSPRRTPAAPHHRRRARRHRRRLIREGRLGREPRPGPRRTTSAVGSARSRSEPGRRRPEGRVLEQPAERLGHGVGVSSGCRAKQRRWQQRRGVERLVGALRQAGCAGRGRGRPTWCRLRRGDRPGTAAARRPAAELGRPHRSWQRSEVRFVDARASRHDQVDRPADTAVDRQEHPGAWFMMVPRVTWTVSGCGSADRSSWSNAPGSASPASGRSGVDGHGFGSAPLGGQMSRYGAASTRLSGPAVRPRRSRPDGRREVRRAGPSAVAG